MRIGFVSTRLAGVDGVSLEVAKLVKVLGQMGHESFYCAGELDQNTPPAWLVPKMHFKHPDIKAIHDQAFSAPEAPVAFYESIYQIADELRHELEAFVNEFQIDVVVSQNANAIPMNIPLGIAIADLAKRRRLKILCHNHDFYWERERFVINCVQDILDEAFPPRLSTVKHMVINSMMQRRLYALRGVESIYVPNAFDFETPAPIPDDYANTFRREVGLKDDDLIVLQPTRIIRRKGIEKAIELVRRLNDSRLVLVLTGEDSDEAGGWYMNWLHEEAERAGIRYKFVADYVGAERGTSNGHKVFTLWDIYPHAHIVTYPSTYEGFGNALTETVYFRKPLIVHTYPVYLADIKSVGVQAVEFNYNLTETVLAATRKLIDDPKAREAMVENNYSVCLKHFSYSVLRQKLQQALDQ